VKNKMEGTLEAKKGLGGERGERIATPLLERFMRPTLVTEITAASFQKPCAASVCRIDIDSRQNCEETDSPSAHSHREMNEYAMYAAVLSFHFRV